MEKCSLRCHHTDELCQTQHTTTMTVMFSTLYAIIALCSLNVQQEKLDVLISDNNRPKLSNCPV